MNPSISVVVATRNRAASLERMLAELFWGGLEGVEVVVVDGASTDGTIELLRSYGARIRWISEPDRGEYDALNKGIGMARGSVVKWMSDDDALLPGVCGCAREYFEAHPEVDILFGHYLLVDERGARRRVFDSRRIRFDPAHFRLRHILRGTRPFPLSMTAFIRRRVFDQVGMLETRYICGDTEFWARCAASGRRMALADRPFLRYQVSGPNGIVVRRWRVLRDHAAIAWRYGTALDAGIFTVLRALGILCDSAGVHPLRWLRGRRPETA